MASGHNRGKLSRQAKAGVGGFTSGRSNAYKKGPGVPGKKSKRAVWFEGPPLLPLKEHKEGHSVSTTYSVGFKG